MQGSCLCGSIRFTLDGELRSARYCYCTHCTKFAGTSPATWAMAESSKLLVLTDGEVGKFDSGRGLRCFCKNCSAPVWFESLDHPEIVAIPLGVLDDGDIPSPEMHLWISSKPGWCPILDDLPRFERGPEPST